MSFICKCQKTKSTTRHLNLSYISILTNLLRTQYICTYVVKKNVPNATKSLVTPSGEVWNHSSH